MSTTANTWTVAGSKKNKVGSSPKVKKPKSFIDSAPRIEPKPPVEESQTIYSVFRQDEDRRDNRVPTFTLAASAAKPANQAVSAQSLGAKKNPTNAKKLPDKKKERLSVLEEALSEVNLSEIEAVLTEVKSKFANHPEVWLKDLASFLNLKLEKVPVSEPTLSGHPVDYPASLLSKPMRSFLTQALSQQSNQILRSFLDHCINTMMSDVVKGTPVYGFHIFIQLILQKVPQIGISSLSGYVALLKDNVTRPPRALCILWALGQAGTSDLCNGLKVWLELMAPVLNIRALSSYAVQYLENLLRLHPSLRHAANTAAVFPKREFFKLFDELFSDQPSLPVELRTRMMQLYPKLKVLAIGSQPEASMHNFFSSFLSRCSSSNGNTQKQKEVLESLIECLSVDKQSFSIWRQIYVKHFPQSSILLKYIISNAEKLQSRLDVGLLRETVRTFAVTNDDLKLRNPSPVSVQDCNSSSKMCSELLLQYSRSRFALHWIVMVVLLAVGLAFTYDIYTSGSVTGSRTYRALYAAGLIDIMQQAWTRLRLYSTKLFQWLNVNVPVYAAKVTPYVSAAYDALLQATSSAMVLAQPYYQMARSQIVQFTTWLNSQQPAVLNTLSHCLNWCIERVVYGTMFVYSYVDWCAGWILDNILIGSWSPENIQRILSSASTAVVTALANFYRWIISLIGG